jgi:hypothetical protein
MWPHVLPGLHYFNEACEVLRIRIQQQRLGRKDRVRKEKPLSERHLANINGLKYLRK